MSGWKEEAEWGSREERNDEEKENKSGKRQKQGLQNEAADRQRGTMSSAVAPAGVRQVHLMIHLLVWLTQTL